MSTHVFPRTLGRLAALLVLVTSLAACQDDADSGPAAGGGDPVTETPDSPRDGKAWETARQPYVAADGKVELYFTRPGTSAEEGEDPEVDDALAALIDSAQQRVDLCLFEFDRPIIVQAVLDAIDRGVEVRFAGDGDELEHGEYGYQLLADAGLPMALRKPHDRIMHNKITLVDDRWVVTGSMNFSENGVLRNNNHVAIIDSPELALQYRKELEQMYVQQKFGTSKDPDPDKAPVEIGGRPIELHFSPQDDVDQRMLEALATADEKVLFMIFSFTHDGIAGALRNLHDTGVEVVGVFDESQARSRYSQDDAMAAHGVPVRIDGNENAIGFAGGKLHHKVMIIDPGTDSDPLVVVGSYNWSNAATKYNDENIAILRGADLVAPFIEEFCEVYDVAVDHEAYLGVAPDPCANLLRPVRINEILANPEGSDTDHEYVELVNTGSATIDMSGWKLGDIYRDDRHVFEDLVLPPGASVVVYSGPSPEDPDRLVASSGALGLNNNAEELSLVDAAGTLIDRVAYTSAESGVSFNRDPDGAVAGDFVLHDTLAPEAAPTSPGAMVDGTPWEPATVPPTLVLNEVMADPEGSDHTGEYVELVNVTDAPLDVSGWTVEDAVSTRHVFPEGATVPADAAVVIFSGGEPTAPGAVVASSGNLGLNNSGDTVLLKDAGGVVVDAVTWSSTETGVAINRASDSDAWALLVPHTELALDARGGSPGTQVNGTQFPGQGLPEVVFINEVLPNPDGSDTGEEYVEIVNTSQVAVDLGLWKLSDADSVRHIFESGFLLGPDEAVVLYDGGGHDAVLGATLASTGYLSLNNSGETLTLEDGAGAVVDTVSWDASDSGVALNRAVDGDPAAAMAPHTTVSPTGAPTSPGATADGATFTGEVLPVTVGVNELLPNPDGTDSGQEFVEIVNASAVSVDLSGWTLSDALGLRHTFAEGTWLGAGDAVVVFDSGDHSAIPGAATSTTGSLSLNNSGDTVTLASPDSGYTSVATWTSSDSGVSLNRSPDGDPDGALTGHDTVAPDGALLSPGTKADGTPW